MEIQSLFGDVPIATFVEQYLHRLPFALAGSAKCACELGSWNALGLMLGGPKENVFAVRGGEWHSGPMPQDEAATRTLGDEGYTIFIRHAERHHPGLADLARAFERIFMGPVNIHVFVTPAGAPGFSWHYDAEDVFIIQTAGAKEYSLRKNTVNPWPLEETLPADMQYEREQMPLMRVLLRAGDLLYIPCGYWHKAVARGWGRGTGDSQLHSPQPPVPSPHETAISIAVGVMSRSAMDVFDFLRARLVQSLVWRQRLPLTGAASPLSNDQLLREYERVFQQLASDLKRTLADPQLARDFIDHLSMAATVEPPASGQQK